MTAAAEAGLLPDRSALLEDVVGVEDAGGHAGTPLHHDELIGTQGFGAVRRNYLFR
ncbi:MAG TPA: hypothetical protein VL985_10485 [Stellaceae bacterium]|nr:hypothetical protein [Stellaceae bacterium]